MSKQCPKCALVNHPNSLRCDCGYDFETRQVERSYLSASNSAIAVWRTGNLLVTKRETALPSGRCVKCNAPSDGQVLKRKFLWHNPWLHLMLVFPGLLIYAIVALIVQKKATVGIFICKRHRKGRRNTILIAWLIVVVGLTLIGLDATILTNGLAALVGVFLLLGAGIFGFVATRLLVPNRIDTEYAYLKGASPAYLDQLQELKVSSR